MRPISLELGDSLSLLSKWRDPVVIISDGPYALGKRGGYDGDLINEASLAKWYEPHVAAWAARATPLTTLWFWNTEVGWAEVHPVLKKYGWIYRSCNIWDKGIAHVAGNSNTKTLRKFPVVTEVCAHYVRHPKFVLGNNRDLSAQDWLRNEWKRTGLPFSRANEACNVKNAATRKYLTKDWMWYFPPPDVFEKLVQYSNENGDPAGKPYFSADGEAPMTSSQWNQLRGKFFCKIGISNVWNTPAIRGAERLKKGGKAIFNNQKPLELMKLIIECSSEIDDVIYEPFGGLCSASIAASILDRNAYAAEINEVVYQQAKRRINKELNSDIDFSA